VVLFAFGCFGIFTYARILGVKRLIIGAALLVLDIIDIIGTATDIIHWGTTHQVPIPSVESFIPQHLVGYGLSLPWVVLPL